MAKIAIFEDDEGIQILLTRSLRKNGVSVEDVLKFASLTDFDVWSEDQAHGFKIDILFLDHNLPGSPDGGKILAKMKEGGHLNDNYVAFGISDSDQPYIDAENKFGKDTEQIAAASFKSAEIYKKLESQEPEIVREVAEPA